MPGRGQQELASTVNDRLETLVTVRDWLRYAVSRFEKAQLHYGHGTTRALDEAAFLILSALELPIEELEPWLDARLIMEERRRLARLIDARIETRKPAPYLVNRAYIRGRRFYVDERAIVPRSFIGELICETMDSPDHDVSPLSFDPADMRRVLDLCTGGGSLAILAAMAIPGARIDAVDISPDALDVARRNVADYGLADRIELIASDLFSALGGRTYDLILANPPYVPEDRVQQFPPEHAAEPRLAHAGGADGLAVIRRILAEAPQHLASEGYLVVEIGQARAELEASFPELPFVWLDTADSHAEVFCLSARDFSAPPPSRNATRRRPGRR